MRQSGALLPALVLLVEVVLSVVGVPLELAADLQLSFVLYFLGRDGLLSLMMVLVSGTRLELALRHELIVTVLDDTSSLTRSVMIVIGGVVRRITFKLSSNFEFTLMPDQVRKGVVLVTFVMVLICGS